MPPLDYLNQKKMLAFTVRYLSEVFAFISAIIFKIPFNFLEFLLFQIKKKGGGGGGKTPNPHHPPPP